jgi:pSer/pThr/pTyr-binding forkhead associated (FHA) protein
MTRVQLHSARSDDPSADDVVIDRFPFTIGRHPACDWRLDLPEISRRHCSLLLHEGRVWVQDLDSTNGTYVNGREAVLPEELGDAAELRLGSQVFEVRVERDEGQARPRRRA